mgnify:CR=1 FL=1
MTDEVTDSCGCVFCDLGLEPEEHDGGLIHRVDMCDPPWAPCYRKLAEIDRRIAGAFTPEEWAATRERCERRLRAWMKRDDKPGKFMGREGREFKGVRKGERKMNHE